VTWNQFWTRKDRPPPSDLCAWTVLIVVWGCAVPIVVLLALAMVGYAAVYGRAAMWAKYARIKREEEETERARAYARARMIHYGMLPEDADAAVEKVQAQGPNA
jgi:hypothetical protein